MNYTLVDFCKIPLKYIWMIYLNIFKQMSNQIIYKIVFENNI